MFISFEMRLLVYSDKKLIHKKKNWCKLCAWWHWGLYGSGGGGGSCFTWLCMAWHSIMANKRERQRHQIYLHSSIYSPPHTRIFLCPCRSHPTYCRKREREKTMNVRQQNVCSVWFWFWFTYTGSPGGLRFTFCEQFLIRWIVNGWSSNIFRWHFRFHNWDIFVRCQCRVHFFTRHIRFIFDSNGLLLKSCEIILMAFCVFFLTI